MKKFVFALVVAVALSFAGTMPVSAQSAGTIVKVPFSFIVNGRVLPAGSYRIAPQAGDPALITISSVDRNAASVSVFVNDTGTVAPREASDSSAKFVTYNGQRFLQEVALPDGRVRTLNVTAAKAQHMLAKLNLMPAQPAQSAR